ALRARQGRRGVARGPRTGRGTPLRSDVGRAQRASLPSSWCALEEEVRRLARDVLRNRERRSRGGRRRIEDVQLASGALEDEVVDESPVRPERLGADARGPELDVADPDR